MDFINKIGELTTLSDKAKEYILKNTEQITLSKNEEVLRNGQVCKHLYFLKRGMMRGYYLLENREVTNWLAIENDWCTSYYSFISQSKSYETIACLETCEVDVVSYKVLHEAYQLFPETERAGRLILEDYYSRLEERMISIQFKSAKERYTQLFKKRPEIIRRAPLGCIASYLGITQETLSRIRAEL